MNDSNPFPGRRRTITVNAVNAVQPEIKHEDAKEDAQENAPEEAVLKEVKEVKKGRGLCPKCKVKPNYYFHVKSCRG